MLDRYRDEEFDPWANISHSSTSTPGFHDVFRRAGQPWHYFNNALRYYYAMMSSIDYELGRVFARMKEFGIWDATNMIFTTDHGDSHGAHNGLENKSYHAFEETTHIPLVIKPARGAEADAGQLGGIPGASETRFANTCDIYSTVLKLAGIDRASL